MQNLDTGIKDPVNSLKQTKIDIKKARGRKRELLEFKFRFLSEMIIEFEGEWNYIDKKLKLIEDEDKRIEEEWIKIRDQYLILKSIKQELDGKRTKR